MVFTLIMNNFIQIQKIEHETMSQRVYKDLKDLIMGGKVEPGQKLTLKSLADALGTSQMPVREALRQLAAEGALEFMPNRSIRVPIMTTDKFNELLQIRQALEGLAVEEAARVITNDELLELERQHSIYLMESAKRKPDVSVAIEANMRLHFATYKAAKLPSLLNIIEGLWLQIGPVLNLDLRSEPKRLTSGPAISHHAQMIKALKLRDPIKARKALAADLSATASYIINSKRLK